MANEERAARAERLEAFLATETGRAKLRLMESILGSIAPAVVSKLKETLTEKQRDQGVAFAAAVCAERLSRTALYVLANEDEAKAEDKTAGRPDAW